MLKYIVIGKAYKVSMECKEVVEMMKFNGDIKVKDLCGKGSKSFIITECR